jgi:hypothetical protein
MSRILYSGPTDDQIAAAGPLQAAALSCNTFGDPDVSVGDEGASLIIDTDGEESSGTDIDNLFCILDELDVSDSVMARMENTRALDGTQEAEWGEFFASWTYHPDDGLDVIIEDAG